MLLESVDEAVQLDDLTAFSEMLSETFPAEQNLQDEQDTWKTIPRERLLQSIRPLAVNQPCADLFDAASPEECLNHLRMTPHCITGPGLMHFARAVRDGAPGFSGVIHRTNIRGEPISGTVESRFIRADGLVLGCHIIRGTRIVRRLEDELTKIRQLHSLAVRASNTGCWEVSFLDRRISLDAICHQLMGYQDATLPQKTGHYLKLIHPDDVESVRQAAERIENGAQEEFRSEYRLQHASGTWRWLLVHGRGVDVGVDGRPERMVGTLRLIDREKKAAELLQIEKQGFAMQAANRPLRDTLQQICRSLENVWPGVRCSINLFDSVTRTVREAVAPSLPDHFRSLLKNFNVDRVPTVCGDVLTARQPVTVPDLLSDDRYVDMRDNYRRWDVRRCWSVPVMTPDGRLMATVCVFSDAPGPAPEEDLELLANFASSLAMLIHQYWKDEHQRHLEARVQMQDKYQSLGKLAGSIAHDFNNLLTVIAGHGEILQTELADNPFAVETTEKILHAVRLAASLCRQMLTFAGRTQVKMEIVDMNDIASEVCSLLRPGLPDGVTLQTRFSARSALLRGDRGMLAQIIMNLVANAAEAAAGTDGRIGVSVQVGQLNVPHDELLVSDDMDVSADWISISVSDNGGGIPAAIREKIFEPFYSTKESGKGLGLATVMGIVRRHRGTVHIASEPGDTVIRVFLPAVTEPPDPAGDETSGPEAVSDVFRRVLVTDDDRAVRSLLTTMLQSAGFQVQSYSSGDDLLRHADDIRPDDVLLLDQNMPGRTGSDTYRELRALGKQNVVCFVTAFESEPLRPIIETDDRCRIVHKPLTIDTIRRTIGSLAGEQNREPTDSAV